MNTRVAAKLAFICLGVLALIDAILLLGSVFATFAIAPRGDCNRLLMTVGGTVPFFIIAALAIYLLLRSNALAVKHFPEVSRTEELVSLKDLQRLTFVCLGLFLLISAIPGTSSFVVLLSSLKKSVEVDLFTKLRIGEGVGRVIQLAIGIYLIVAVGG